ncbi:hypothetical protein BJ878DRAFT_195341 [Calycina marina]|uniref:MINDY deubiquitinase domain-containing protein n=1 Tax=Calycina marina TaxID=1763456 RepID=A0A9P8CCI6_9HELO|nr:hypothetical protein BJ878DRAFT_195341 [Calycina marina]
MVSRKPVANQGPSSAPYPISPITSDAPPFLQNLGAQDTNTQGEEERNTANTQHVAEVPLALRIGPLGGIQHHPSQQDIRKGTALNTNPFIPKHNTGGPAEGQENSASVWGKDAESSQPSRAPPPPVTLSEATPLLNHHFSNLSIDESSTNPWQPTLDRKASSNGAHSVNSISRDDLGNDVWSDANAQKPKNILLDQPVLVDIEETESPGWDEDSSPSPTVHEMPATPLHTQEQGQILEDQHAWDDTQGQTLASSYVKPPPLAQEESFRQGEGWNIVDRVPVVDVGHQESGVVGANGMVLESRTSEEHAPPLPPRISIEFPPAQPPRPAPSTNDASSSSRFGPLSAETIAQKKESYEIKKVSWHDVNAVQNPRISPILVQNKNGPCPLLALVNALTLSTPAGVETALVETLRSREQVSLGLLLDAVFDELMSGRRGEAAQELPDVSELYAFLLALHTGMNVNPRFFPAAPTKSSADIRNHMSHVHLLSEREENLPGTFEDSKEMKLYGTFSVPLIHGWLPEHTSPAFSALQRRAQSYEDAQSVFFYEEVLEDKLQAEGLGFEEQATLEDIHTIKAFFSSSATQLTWFGLDIITNSIAPGAVAILFRNDHFSTLYRHPQTQQLLQLVTDMGYARHEEVVWESLIDINGERAEFFSGDFRFVGGPPEIARPAHASENSHDPRIPIRGDNGSEVPQSPTTEQEDRDLALALQLQDEEDERHRNEVDRQRRETELSRQFIEQQGRGEGGNITESQGPQGGRGRGNRGDRGGRRQSSTANSRVQPRPVAPPQRRNQPPTVSRPDSEAVVDVPPPSYELAATHEPYEPPTNHPAHASSSPATSRTSTYSGSANPQAQQQAVGGRPPTYMQQIDNRRRQPSSQQQPPTGSYQGEQDGSRKERDCIMM